MPTSHILFDIVVLMGAALAVAWLFRIARAPTVVGFLFTGVLIGPSGAGLIRPAEVEIFAEIGLVLLLFTVGLELSPEPLVRAGMALVRAGIIQIFGTFGIVFVALYWSMPHGAGTVGIVAVVITLSSTAIVLRHLTQHGQMDSPAGTITTGILLQQDVAVILLLLFLPLVGAQHGAGWLPIAKQAALALLALPILAWLGRMLLPVALHHIVVRGGRELMTLFAVAAACAGAWAADWAGWSWALGACVVGLVLAETEARHQLVAEITPFRDVFNALFFISLGMLVDLEVVGVYGWGLLAAVLLTLLGKFVLTAGAVIIAGWPVRLGAHLGLLLCSVSEFGYVAAREAGALGLLPTGLLDILVAYAVGTMLVGALLLPAAEHSANRIADWVGSLPGVSRLALRSSNRPSSAGRLAPAHEQLSGHVVIVGFGFSGQSLARILTAAGIPHVVIEMNPKLAAIARRAGIRLVVGDATRVSILEQAGLARARAVVLLINDRGAAQRIVAQVRSARPELYILVRTHYLSELDVLVRLGAQNVIAAEFEAAIEIFAHVLKEFNIPDNLVEAELAAIRAGGYAIFRPETSRTAAAVDLSKLLEQTTTQTLYLDETSHAPGRTIRQLDLRARTGATIIAVVRGGTPHANPPADMELSAADVLVLVGTHAQLQAARAVIG